MDGSQPLDPRKTIFVGGVPRPLRAGMIKQTETLLSFSIRKIKIFRINSPAAFELMCKSENS
jgi:hypothetical protein